jgi:maleate isomerase
MKYGTVGIVKPTWRPGGLEEFIRLIPDGIGVIPLFLGVHRGTADEFASVWDAVEPLVAKLAELEVDLIHPEGAPPFMQLGVAGETELVERWRKKYGIPVVTAPQTQLAAMRALGMKRIVGLTYFVGPLNDVFARYFVEAGFDVLAMSGIEVAFDRVGNLTAAEVIEHGRRAFAAAGGADGVYMLGSGWRVLEVIEPLERELGVPVVHAIPARAWYVQHFFHALEPRRGFGRLLADLPPPVTAAAVA